MRPFKFRFWDKLISKFIYASLHSYFDSPEYIPEQFTGILDENAKEIYEGDIIQWGNKKIRGVVSFQPGVFIVTSGNSLIYPLNTIKGKIIGNIHEQ